MRVEKHNKPEIEMLQFSKKKTNSIVMNPIYLARSEGEHCLIEASINSVRVKKIKKKSMSKIPLPLGVVRFQKTGAS